MIVIGESKIEEQLEKAITRANKLIEKRTDLGNVLGVFLCGISLVAQLFLLPAFPVWGVVIMAVDLVLIYTLTVHGYAFG